jgi:hypothetical protein
VLRRFARRREGIAHGAWRLIVLVRTFAYNTGQTFDGRLRWLIPLVTSMESPPFGSAGEYEAGRKAGIAEGRPAVCLVHAGFP